MLQESVFDAGSHVLHILAAHGDGGIVRSVQELVARGGEEDLEETEDEREERTERQNEEWWMSFVRVLRCASSVEVLLSVVRCVGALLLAFRRKGEEAVLDVVVNSPSEARASEGEEEEEEEENTLGSMLAFEMCAVFKRVYFPGKKQETLDGGPAAENALTDVVDALCVLFLSSCQAKIAAVQQRFLRKAADYIGETSAAVHLAHIQQIGSGARTKGSTGRRGDFEFCERECVRMLRLVRHLFYGSEDLLADMVLDTSEAKSKTGKSKLCCVKAVDEAPNVVQMLARVWEESVPCSAAVEKEFYATAHTISAQGCFYKRAFTQSLYNRKTSLLRLVVDGAMPMNV